MLKVCISMSLFFTVPATIEESITDGDKIGDQSESCELIFKFVY